MSRILWREAMAIDHGLIDSDHRYLIDFINRFQQLPRGNASSAEAVETLHALKFYADTHFSREEQLQRLVGYPDNHHDKHTKLIEALDDIIARARAITRADSAIVQELGNLLQHWLLDHIIREDLLMKPYIHLMKPHAATLPRLTARAAAVPASNTSP